MIDSEKQKVMKSSLYQWTPNYFSLLSFDLRLDALFLWITFFLASLSINETTPGKSLPASFLVLDSFNFLIAFLVVLCWSLFNDFFFSFERILFKADLWFAIIFNFVARRGIEPLFPGWKPEVLTDRRTGLSGANLI